MTIKRLFFLVLLSVVVFTTGVVVVLWAVWIQTAPPKHICGQKSGIPWRDANDKWRCNFKTSDAGKPCKNSGECTGLCSGGLFDPDQPNTGNCSAYIYPASDFGEWSIDGKYKQLPAGN